MDRKFRNIIIFISCMLLLISIGYSNGGRASVTIVENFASKVVFPIKGFFIKVSNTTEEKIDDVRKIWKNKRLIAKLEKENSQLKKEIINLNLKSYQLNKFNDLKNNLNYIERKSFGSYVTCDVVSKDLGNWFNMFTINAGLKDGIDKYSIVISEKGLIGKVYEVGDNYAKVISIIDDKSKISFETLAVDHKYQGIVDRSENGLLHARVFEPNPDISIGMDVITTGQGIYPRGLLIGKIIEIENDKNNFLRKVVIEPSVNFKDLQYVMVIPMDSEKQEWIYEE